jgi:hypothetical protein
MQTAAALAKDGHDVRVLSSHRHATRATTEGGVSVVRTARLPEAPLRHRGFTGPLTHAPLTLRALMTGGYDVAHAFTPEDAWIAIRWRRRSERPVLFTVAEPLARDRLSDRRLRLRAVQAAADETDAVTATSEELAEIAARWLAVEPTVIDPADGAGHAALYRDVIARRRR